MPTTSAARPARASDGLARSEARRHAISGPMPMRRTSGRPKAIAKKS